MSALLKKKHKKLEHAGIVDFHPIYQYSQTLYKTEMDRNNKMKNEKI